jgi:hypothetical protein
VGRPEQNVLAKVTVGLNNAGVEVVSAQMAENIPGVYEVVFKVPDDVVQGPDRPLGFFIEVVPGIPIYSNGSLLSIGPQ